jgi:hypothetical protein
MFNDVNLNDCWPGAIPPVSAGAGLSQHVDELRNHWSGYRLRLSGGAHALSTAVRLLKTTFLGGYLLQRLADHRHSKPNASTLAAPSASLTIGGLPDLFTTQKSFKW